jgi:hypothetical protein
MRGRRTLRLNREVLAELTRDQLSAVAGGTTGATTKLTTAIASLDRDCLSLNTCRSCQICTDDGACY